MTDIVASQSEEEGKKKAARLREKRHRRHQLIEILVNQDLDRDKAIPEFFRVNVRLKRRSHSEK